MKNPALLVYIPLLLYLGSCQHSDRNTDQAGSSGQGGVSVEATGEIIVSREQFESAGMKMGKPSSVMFSTAIHANGHVVPETNGSAEISTLISGRVGQINYSEGDQVKRGAVLFTLESDEIISLQQSYAETCQQLKLLKSDFERLSSLSQENIVAQKDFLRAESEYRTMQAKEAGLKARLEMIHIDPARVEEGEIFPYQSVKSPISGNITRQTLVQGQYIELDESPIEIVNSQKLRLSLLVFENSLSELAVGQEVLFFTPDQPGIQHNATLSHVGKEVSSENRTIQCFATIQRSDLGSFINRMYVEADIVTCEREALALPEVALIREPDRDFVLNLVEEKENYFIFRKIPVGTGVTRQGYTEILEQDLNSVLVSGVYNLLVED